MKKWQYAAIAAVVIVCILAAAFFFGDTSQPETGEEMPSIQAATAPSAPTREASADTSPLATTEPSTAAPSTATESTAVQNTATEPTTTLPPATLTTEPPVTEQPTTEPPVTEQPTTESPVTEQPTTEPPVTEPSTTAATELPTQPPVPRCTIYISCATVLSHMDDLTAGKEAIVPENGWMLGTVSVELQEGDTVFDVLQRVTRQYGIALEFSVSPVYNTAYIEGIGNLYERDCGTGSGWLYAVNGSFPSVGCSDCTVSDGDSIAWLYTCEMGADLS